jgi:hypothetical protein
LPPGWLCKIERTGFLDQVTHRLEDDYDDAALFLVKDPRICRLLPLYALALDRLDVELRVILCVRHPSEVVRSIVFRDGISPDKAAMLWARHVLDAERDSRAYLRGWVNYADTLEDCERVLDGLGRSVCLPLLGYPERLSVDLRSMVQPAAQHWRSTQDDPTLHDLPFLAATWGAVRRDLSGDEVGAMRKFDELHSVLDEFDRYHDEDSRRAEELYASNSWRITAPLRRLKTAFQAI